MLFGILGAPLAFQWLINSVVHGLLRDLAFAFLEDIMTVSQVSHDKIRKVFAWL